MKTWIVRSFFLSLILVAFLALGYYGSRWWSTHQRQKELASYFHQESPVTRRMPEDAILYLDLYDVRRLHAGLQGTRLQRVYSHWLDTNLGDQKSAPNPVVGGMLEKTILNLLGLEVGIALAPGTENVLDLVVVSRLAPGSDFLMKLALSQNKKLERNDYGDNTIFTLYSGDLAYARVYLSLDSDHAYASTSLDRIRKSIDGKSKGPSFLRELMQEPLPKTTLLFLKGKDPRLSVLGFMEGRRLRLQAECESLFHGPESREESSANSVLDLLTNITEILKQPSAFYSIHKVDGAAVSTLMFDPPPQIAKPGRPMILNLRFNKPAVREFAGMADREDWSRFADSKELYFLSCFRSITGGLNENGNEIIAEFE